MSIRPRRRLLVPAALAVLTIGAQHASAISDGNYDSAKNGCDANAKDSDRPSHVEQHCYTAVVALDGKAHRFVSVGVPETPDGTSADAAELCIDLTGTKHCLYVDATGIKAEDPEPGTPVYLHNGELHAYFGADDNLDSGEHDGSSTIANGPSDGGAIQVNLTPLEVHHWLVDALTGGKQFVLTHPLPIADAGTGACADGLCFSVQTMRRVAYTAGNPNAPTRDAADYDGHIWDPPTCAGPTDAPSDCGGQPIAWWHQVNQTTYVEPGIQIYEDPDPQASPAGPYPLPAIYFGTCGLVVGGGDAPDFPATPVTNKSGQILVQTGC